MSNKKVKIRFCKDCEKQENLNNAPISGEIERKDVIIDSKEIIKNFNRASNSYLAYLNSWK